MADRIQVKRDKHESPTERPREAKMARANRPRTQKANPEGVGRRQAGDKRSTTRNATGANARKTTGGRRQVQARNRPALPRRAAERLNKPQSRTRARSQVDATKDHIRQRADNAPLGVRRAANMTPEEVASPDVSLEVAHGPEGEANAGQDLREPRMIPRKGGKDSNARHTKGRAERRPGGRAPAGET